MPRVLLALVVSTLGGGPPSHPAIRAAPDVRSCRACHQQIVATFIETAHFRTSAEATAQSVKARFTEGHDVLRTGAAGIYFRMERRNGVFYETGVDSGRGTSRAERIDIVLGSGRRGQSYLYWRNGLLFELPVSYLTGIGQWINSPGYPDGQIDFGRLIVPRCLECHSTSITLTTDRRALRYSRPYVLGLSCENATATLARTSGISHLTRPTRSGSTFSIPPAFPEIARWTIARYAIPASGIRGDRRSPTDPVTTSTTISCFRRKGSFRFPTFTGIRSRCCAAADAFARARTCRARPATTFTNRSAT